MARHARSTRLVLGPLLVAGLVTAGCSGGSSPDPSPTPAEPSVVPATSTSPDASTSPSLATLPVAQCLTGRYALVRFVALGESNTYGTGQGGDVALTFSGQDYTLAGAGKKPVVLTLAGQSAELTVDGTAEGTFAVDGTKADFKATGADGTATLKAGGQQRTLKMADIASVVGLDGTADVACTDQAMTITLKTVRLELGRV